MYRCLDDNRSIDNFQQFVNRLSLTDLFPAGPLFTWTNRQAYEVKSRLDRFLLSPAWINCFPRSAVHHVSDNGSDHRAIFLMNNQVLYGPKKYFSFDQRWLSNSEAESIISEVALPGIERLKFICFPFETKIFTP
ncbi:hypothetical protein LINGRAPRIM_LOCUS5 [Linum grandiflorum]